MTVFDKFHVLQHFSAALDEVRRQELRGDALNVLEEEVAEPFHFRQSTAPPLYSHQSRPVFRRVPSQPGRYQCGT